MAPSAALLLALLWAADAGAGEAAPPADGAVEPAADAGGVETSGGLPPIECVALLRRARLAQMRGDATGQLETLREAARDYPRELAPLYALLLYHVQHPLSEAEHEDLSARLVAAFQDRERPLPVGFLDYLAHDPETDDATLALTLEHLAARLATIPATPELMAVRARLEERLDRREEAVATLERLWRTTGAPGDLWRLFQLQYRLGRWADALASADQMRGEDWTPPPLALLELVSRAGDLARTRTQVAAAVAATDLGEPSAREHLVRVLTNAAWALRDAGEDAGAEELFRRALDLDPESPSLHAVLLHLYGSEDERRAHAEAVDAGWAKTDDPRQLFDEGTRRLSTGDAQGAIELLRRAAPGLPDLEPAWYNLALAAYRLEEWATAAAALERAVALNPGRGQSYLYRGIALSKLERCREAIESLLTARGLGVEERTLDYVLYECYKKLGDAAAAKAAYDRYKASGSP